MPAAKSAITVEFPEDLLRRTDQTAKATGTNRSKFIRAAVQESIRQVRRELIDAEFAKMAADEDYRKLHEQISGEFAASDVEALGSNEA